MKLKDIRRKDTVITNKQPTEEFIVISMAYNQFTDTKRFIPFLLVASTIVGIEGCNLNRSQCREEHNSGNFSEKSQTDCYERTKAFGNPIVEACVDTCDPSIEIGHYIAKCEDFCTIKGE